MQKSLLKTIVSKHHASGYGARRKVEQDGLIIKIKPLWEWLTEKTSRV